MWDPVDAVCVKTELVMKPNGRVVSSLASQLLMKMLSLNVPQNRDSFDLSKLN